jgi:hypothetical protein
VGHFKNQGRELRPKGCLEEVLVYDFLALGKDKATPYGVYDVSQNKGWVSVGVDHDTAAFAVESIRRWWNKMGRQVYPQAKRLLITADSGGSNGAGVSLWKTELQRFTNETGLSVSACDRELKTVNLIRDAFHGEWNYTIKPEERFLQKPRESRSCFRGCPAWAR